MILNIPLIGMWVRLLAIPYSLLFPAIVLFTCIGVYSTNNNVFDIHVLLVFGAVGYLMLLLRLEVVPVLLGFILGPMFEEYLRRTLLLSRGDFAVFLERPISACALAFTAVLVSWSLWSYLRRRRATAPLKRLMRLRVIHGGRRCATPPRRRARQRQVNLGRRAVGLRRRSGTKPTPPPGLSVQDRTTGTSACTRP